MKKILLFTLSICVSILPPFFAANTLPLEEGSSSIFIGQNRVSYNQSAGILSIDSPALTANRTSLPRFFDANTLPLEEGSSSISIGQNRVSYDQWLIYNQWARGRSIDSPAGTLNITSEDMRHLRDFIKNNLDEAALVLFGGVGSLLTLLLAPEEYRKKAAVSFAVISLTAYCIKKLMNDSRTNVERRVPRG